MAATKLKSDTLALALAHLTPNKKFCVALSGGIDSVVLLHLMHQLAKSDKRIHVRAIHVNHGLSQFADQWQAHCETICKAFDIPIEIERIQVKKIPGESLEAILRHQRYERLEKAIMPDESLLTAHNANDQAETLLLQLLRGAGINGLAAMPSKKKFANAELLRPFLQINRDVIEAYAKANHLTWIDDESNRNTQFDRNYLRHLVLPIIKKRWPEAVLMLNRSASHSASALQFMQVVAEEDLLLIQKPEGTLDISMLLRLEKPRQHNVLRYWIQKHGFKLPSTKQLAEIYSSIIFAKEDGNPKMCWKTHEIRRYQHALYISKPLKSALRDYKKIWNLNSEFLLPNDLGCLTIQKTESHGIDLNKIGKELLVCFRRGGEYLCPAGRKETHRLKKLFQEWEVPPWQRDRIPLLFLQDELVAVVGYCVAEAFSTKSDAVTVTHVKKCKDY